MSSTPIVATALALVATSLSVGYMIGAKTAARSSPPPPLSPLPPVDDAPTPESVSASDGEESEVEDMVAVSAADGDLSSVKPGITEPCKLVLVVRTDLKMTTGKIAAQCGHATLACYKALVKTNPAIIQHWERLGQTKIALKADSEEELLELEAVAKSLNLCARSIQDAGRTQVAAGSRTVLGIGPGPVELVNRVTGKLRLL